MNVKISGLWAAGLAFCLLAAAAPTPAHPPGKHQNEAASAKAGTAAAAKNSKTLVLSLAGLHCEGCAASVKRHLSGVPGVARVVSVSAKEQKAVVQVGKTAPKTAALKTAVKDAGYQCVRVDTGGTEVK